MTETERKLAKKIWRKKYRKSAHGRRVIRRYNQSKKGKLIQAAQNKRYAKTPHGKAALRRSVFKYFKTPKGKAAVARAIKKWYHGTRKKTEKARLKKGLCILCGKNPVAHSRGGKRCNPCLDRQAVASLAWYRRSRQ